MKEVTTVGIDLAKNIFHLHGVDKNGKVVFSKTLRRKQLMPFILNLQPCLIGIEACCSSYYWCRQFKKHGHTVRLISPQFVKPYVKTNKSDKNDAEAICEAVARPNMRFVPEKNVHQQDVQVIHRVRSRLMTEKTRLTNAVRGFLAERGIFMTVGKWNLHKELPVILETENEEFTPMLRELVLEMYEELKQIEDRISKMDKKIQQVFKSNEVCKRISEIEGIGPITATAIVAAVGDAHNFENGRHMAAWLGLVPKQHSSGGKVRLMGISKRGDSYIRSLLVHGGRSVVYKATNKTDSRSEWITDKAIRRGNNKAAVAVANKNVRIIWKMMVSGEDYRKTA